MSCTKFEKWVALSMEMQLPRRKARKLAAHLEGCAACRELAAGLEETRAALAMLEAVPGAALEGVRTHVLGEVRRTAPPSAAQGPWRWVMAAAAAVVVLAVLFWPKPAPPPPAVPVARQAEVEQPLSLPKTGKPKAAPARRARAARRVHPAPVRKQPSPPPLLVKMQVDDPDIVILWLVDENGG
jgi:hypothetical protein